MGAGDDETVTLRVRTGMAPGSGRLPCYDVTVFPETGNMRFTLSDGTLYDYDASDLGFGETDPVRRARAMEAIEVVTMARRDNSDIFERSRARRYPDW